MLRRGLRVVPGWGGEQAQAWFELDERSRGRLPVGYLLGESAEAERAGLPGEYGQAGAAGSQLGEQHRRCALVRCLACEAERERRRAGAADEAADRDERAAGFVEREPAGERCLAAPGVQEWDAGG